MIQSHYHSLLDKKSEEKKIYESPLEKIVNRTSKHSFRSLQSYACMTSCSTSPFLISPVALMYTAYHIKTLNLP